jgi:hypothetical protein
MRDELIRARLGETARLLASASRPELTVLHRRVRRRRIRIGASTLAVSMVLGAGAAVGGAHVRETGVHRSPAAAAWRPAGPPLPADAGPSAAPYLVTIAFQQAPAAVKVQNVVTGKVLATVRPPQTSGPADFVEVAAAGDDRTFFLLSQLSGGQAVYYELRLNPDGTVRSLTKVLTGTGSSAFAVSPDATRLAYTTGNGITVVSLPTGARRSWTTKATDVVTDLSWAGDRMLAFGWQVNDAASPRAGVRLLDTAAAGSDLMASRLVVPVDRTLPGGFSGAQSALIAAGGSVVFVTVDNGSVADPRSEVVEYSVRTGRMLAVLTPSAFESGMGTSCMALWSDPSGAQVAAECGDGVDVYGHGRFVHTGLHAPAYGYSDGRQLFVAW